MKCIYPDNISSITADEEDANYPASNLQDNHPKKVWKGLSRDAIVTAVVSGGGALAIFATNATSVTIVISSGQTISWDTGFSWSVGFSWDSSGNTDTTETVLLTGDIDGLVWSDFATIRVSSFTATITLTTDAGQIIQAGIIRCGTLRSFSDPIPGIGEGLVDYSIVKELNNGATYIRKRDVVRTMQFQIIPATNTIFYTFMIDVAKANGPNPLAWRVMVSITDEEWIVFARTNVMPSGTHKALKYRPINVSLLEVL